MASPRSALIRILPALVMLMLGVGGYAQAQIVAFGASNISGWNVAASEAIPAQLQTMLREKGYSVNVRNAGVYGNTTTQMRERMDRDIPDGTTIVVLDTSGGQYNDNRLGISREQGEADLVAIKGRLAERHITVIPISGAEVPPQYHQQDGIHLTPEGHRIAAANVLPEIIAHAWDRHPRPSRAQACTKPASPTRGDCARRYSGTRTNDIHACRSIARSSQRTACTQSSRAESNSRLPRRPIL